ncbi:MAG: hypothetical protein COU71_02315 [Parcubacteria group bacterium CG10_big_fil_rev_8_21_14_0_10_38_31]|nr:MAG: hypothetical protein COU71_02315 [Parcubacteria group bacterium CG10_big_fil_rev_8_21_14_0_10_38_31]
MKFKFLPFLIIIFFIASSIFGFLSMSEMIHSECPLFKMLGGSCSPDANALVLISHHLTVLKTLSSSFVALNFSALLVVLFLVSLMVASLVFLPGKFFFNFRPDKYIRFNPINNLISWLALLNKGDYLLFSPA